MNLISIHTGRALYWTHGYIEICIHTKWGARIHSFVRQIYKTPDTSVDTGHFVYLNHPESLCLTIPKMFYECFKHAPNNLFAYKVPEFSLVLKRNVRSKEAAEEEKEV